MTRDDLPHRTEGTVPEWVHMADVPPTVEPWTKIPYRDTGTTVGGNRFRWLDADPLTTDERIQVAELERESGTWLGAVLLLLAFVAGVIVGVLVSR